jgi:type II secretory pathway component PulJ
VFVYSQETNRAVAPHGLCNRRAAFSLLELMLAGILTTMLSLIAASMSVNLSRVMADSIRDTKLVAELRLAEETIRRDFAGSLPNAPQGTLRANKLVGILVNNNQLRLCFDGGAFNGSADWTSPDRVIVYAVAEGRLMRQDLSDGSAFTIARNVANFSLVADGTRQQVNLELNHRGTVRTVSWNVPTTP